ncbi:glycosyltransferase family 4 protein [bacterium]|nr:glycosyltransferase family 4 protein [bacterium]
MATAASEMGYEVNVLAPSYGKNLVDFDQENYKYRIHRYSGGTFSPRALLPMIWRSWRWISRGEHDIIHAVDWPHIVTIAFLKKFISVSFIASLHGSEILIAKASKYTKTLQLKDIFWSPQKLLTNSKFTKNLLLERFPELPAEKICVAPLGINSYWRKSVNTPTDFRRRYGIPDNHRILLTVSRIDKRKGHSLVLKAIKNLPCDVKQRLSYLVVGEGEDLKYLDHLKRLAAASQVSVVFTGKVKKTQLRDLYRAADIFCLPGQSHPKRIEGFGLVFLEAASQGLPSIASNLGAIPEVVLNGKTGLLVSPNDIEDLGKSIESLLSQPALIQSMKNEAREWANGFTWERCVNQTYTL